MFPNFTSIAQREQKRLDLLERSQRRVRQAFAKRAMYADTQWASDADKTLSLSKKITSDASTDTSTDTSSATVEASKKSLSDTSSQKIPEPSLEVKAETPVEVRVKPDANDDESDEDQQTKEALVKIYKIYPVFNKLQLHPVDKNGRFMTKFIIKNGTTIYTTKSKKWAKVDAIDWDATYDSIRIIMQTNPRFLQYVSDLRKAKSNVFPGYQTTEPLKVWESLIGKKRRLSDPLKNDDSNRSKQRLEDSFAVDSSTSPDDGTVGELTLNPYTPSSNEAEARHGIKSGIDADMDKNLTNADNDAKLILGEFFKEIRKQKVKLAFDLNPVIDTTDGVKVQNGLYFSNPTQKRLFNVRYSDDKKATLANDLRDLMANIRWMGTFTALIDGFQIFDKHLTGIDRKSPDEKAAQDNLTQNLGILDGVLKRNTKSTEATSRVKEASIDPYVSLKLLHDEAEAAFQDYGEAMKRYDEAKQATKSRHSKAAKSNLKAATAAMRATKANYNSKLKKYTLFKKGYPDMDLDEFDNIASKREVGRQTKFEVKDPRTEFREPPLTVSSLVDNVVGRGLRGAGRGHLGGQPKLDGVVRKGRTYNLNDIQGMATPSAYTYKPLGSKYIRIPDLDAGMIVIVQPSRRKIGPKREMSEELQKMLKDLVYSKNINQSSYDQLSTDDKKIFKETLAATHLQHSFSEKLADPLEALKAEYFKLKSEIELGNDNPSILKQLKVITVDMYSNHLISDDEFKQVITRLL